MKKFQLILGLALIAITFCFNVYGQEKKEGNNKFDADLAKKLGADQYGMKSYVLVNLKTGPADAEIKDEEERKKIFAGHFANMGRLAKEGKLVLAGPYSDAKPYRGLYIFNVKNASRSGRTGSNRSRRKSRCFCL